jgi:integrase
MLYCCGLRLSEALKLKYSDVNLKTGVLTVRDAKSGNDRLVPISESLREMCGEYILTIQALSDNPYIFPTRFSTDPVTSESAYSYFRKILWEAGIPHGGRGKGPRVHDFRHTFAVHSLQKWVADGVDVYVALPILATYLGHDNIKITEKYLRLTAEVFPEMIKLAENYSQAVIPEVKFYETD